MYYDTGSLHNVLIFLTDYVYFPKHTSPIHQQRFEHLTLTPTGWIQCICNELFMSEILKYHSTMARPSDIAIFSAECNNLWFLGFV